MKTDSDFQLAFIAVRYILGCPAERVLDALRAPSRPAAELAQVLSGSDRTTRARALAPHLTRIVDGLRSGSLRP